jgi:hypothetical protein
MKCRSPRPHSTELILDALPGALSFFGRNSAMRVLCCLNAWIPALSCRARFGFKGRARPHASFREAK